MPFKIASAWLPDMIWKIRICDLKVYWARSKLSSSTVWHKAQLELYDVWDAEAISWSSACTSLRKYKFSLASWMSSVSGLSREGRLWSQSNPCAVNVLKGSSLQQAALGEAQGPSSKKQKSSASATGRPGSEQTQPSKPVPSREDGGPASRSEASRSQSETEVEGGWQMLCFSYYDPCQCGDLGSASVLIRFSYQGIMSVQLSTIMSICVRLLQI